MNANTVGNSGYQVSLAAVAGKQAAAAYRIRLQPTNRILAALPHEVLSSLLPYLKPELLPRGRILCDVDESLRQVYFVERGLVSMVAVFRNRTTAEMATVGREGLVGIGSVLGGERAFARYVVPVPALALAVDACQFRSALQDSPEFRATCNAYAQAFLGEALQTAACNSVHMVEERCARWLLMSRDRCDGDTVAVTQGCLADMLGVCRSTVTLAAGALQKAGLIRYRRGAISVLNRRGLEAASCECYRIIRDQYERLLPRTGEQQTSARKLSLIHKPFLSQGVR